MAQVSNATFVTETRARRLLARPVLDWDLKLQLGPGYEPGGPFKDRTHKNLLLIIDY